MCEQFYGMLDPRKSVINYLTPEPPMRLPSSFGKGGAITMPNRHPKREFLEAVGALHPHPERVQAALFETQRFFDPLDKVQVKYEMLRAHALDQEQVSAVCRSFGFSRETFYSVLESFERFGIVGLRDQKRGPRGPLKMTEDTIAWVRRLHRRQPELSGREIAELLAEEHGIEVHRRTIERFLVGTEKKNP
jgi:transposase